MLPLKFSPIVLTISLLPTLCFADVRLTGTIQAEFTSGEVSNLGGDVNKTKDNQGAAFNEGPNNIEISFEERFKGDIRIFGQYRAGFNTFANRGLDSGQETFIGLRGTSAYLRFGTLSGLYKASKGATDPFQATALQARGTGGGQSGGFYNTKDGVKETNHRGFAHSGYVDNALELGFQFGSLAMALQFITDDSSELDGGGLLEIRYTQPTYSIFLAGAYTDFDIQDTFNDISDINRDNEVLGNWKIGGIYQLDKVKLGLQYEHAELGALDNNQGNYLILSADYRVGNVSAGAWLAGYQADAENEDALSYAVGGKYFFNERTFIYGGYRDTNSDNNDRDENLFALGLRYSF